MIKINKEAINDAKADLAKAKKSAETAASSVARIIPPEGFSVNYSAIAAEIRSLYSKIDSANRWISNKVAAVEQAESTSRALIDQVSASVSSISFGSVLGNSAISSGGGNSSSYFGGGSSVSGLKSESNQSSTNSDTNVKISNKDNTLLIDKILKNNDILGSLDKSLLEKYKNELLKDISDGKINLDEMNEKLIQSEIVSRILQKENLSIDKTFGILEEVSGNYGVDQNALKNMTEEEISEYIETISKKYGLSKEDASKIIQAIRNSELDGYDTECNLIYASFKDNPEKFEKLFGFSLYKTDSEGIISINDVGIMTDVFLTVNSDACGGNLFTITDDGKMKLDSSLLEIDGNGNYKLKGQQDLSSSENIQKIMTDYINTKSEKIELKTEMINDKISPEDMTDEKMNEIKEKIKLGVEGNNGQVVLNLYQDKDNPIKFIDVETKTEYCSTADWKENTEHAVLVTDVNDDGVVVSSWGKKYTISFEDLKNNGKFQTYSKEYSYNTQQVNTNGGISTGSVSTGSAATSMNAGSNDNTNINTEVDSNSNTNTDFIENDSEGKIPNQQNETT